MRTALHELAALPSLQALLAPASAKARERLGRQARPQVMLRVPLMHEDA